MGGAVGRAARLRRRDRRLRRPVHPHRRPHLGPRSRRCRRRAARLHVLRQARAPLAPLPRLRLRAAGDRRVGGHAVPWRAEPLLYASDLADRLPDGLDDAPRRCASTSDPTRPPCCGSRRSSTDPEPWDRDDVRRGGRPARPPDRQPAGRRAGGDRPAALAHPVLRRRVGSPTPCCPDSSTTRPGGTSSSPRTSATDARRADGGGQPPRPPRRGVRGAAAPRLARRRLPQQPAAPPVRHRASRSSTSASGARSRSASTSPSSWSATSRSAGATPTTCPSSPRPA